MSMSVILRPGDEAPSHGLYEVFNPDGSPTGVKYLVEKYKTLPPTFLKNQFFRKVARWFGRRRRAR